MRNFGRLVDRPFLALVFALALLSLPHDAHAVEIDFLGAAREISHSSSASRDTATLQLIAMPHRVLTGGGDFSIFHLRAGGVSLRIGVFAMIELESEGETNGFDGLPTADIRFWRGQWGYSAAVDLHDLAERWLGPRGALELTLSARHESSHYTGSNSGGPGTDYSDRSQLGDCIIFDVALRKALGDVDIVARVQHKFFLPYKSSYSKSPGADLHLRWRRFARVHPFTSFFGEYLDGTRGYPSAYLFRNLTGVFIPSKAGDLALFLSADVGHRKGLAVFTEERTLGFGARFSFF